MDTSQCVAKLICFIQATSVRDIIINILQVDVQDQYLEIASGFSEGIYTKKQRTHKIMYSTVGNLAYKSHDIIVHRALYASPSW